MVFIEIFPNLLNLINCKIPCVFPQWPLWYVKNVLNAHICFFIENNFCLFPRQIHTPLKALLNLDYFLVMDPPFLFKIIIPIFYSYSRSSFLIAMNEFLIFYAMNLIALDSSWLTLLMMDSAFNRISKHKSSLPLPRYNATTFKVCYRINLSN